MRPIRSITTGVVILVLAALAGCIVVPVGGGGHWGDEGYRHDHGRYVEAR